MFLVKSNSKKIFFIYGICENKYLIREHLDWFIWVDKVEFEEFDDKTDYLELISKPDDRFFDNCKGSSIMLVKEFLLNNLRTATRYIDDNYEDFFTGSHNLFTIWRSIYLHNVVLKYEKVNLHIGPPEYFDFNYRLGIIQGYFYKIADDLTQKYSKFATFKSEIRLITYYVISQTDYTIEEQPCDFVEYLEKYSKLNDIPVNTRVIYLLILSLFSFSEIDVFKRIRKNNNSIIKGHFEILIKSESDNISISIDEELN